MVVGYPCREIGLEVRCDNGVIDVIKTWKGVEGSLVRVIRRPHMYRIVAN